VSSIAAAPSRASALAPFRVRSYRFQWPADVATSCAFEMENLILGWYVLVETESVLMLTVFASLQYAGTLFAPMFGVMGDRIGQRNVLCAMRMFYALLAATLMTCGFLGLLRPELVLVVAGLNGLVRPSDFGVRNALIAATLPGAQLFGAMGMQRTTMDLARIGGALSGAGIVAVLGFAPAYAVVVAFYTLSFVLTLQCTRDTGALRVSTTASPWRDLREGLTYVWSTPHLFALMLFAFLLNGTAFPMFMSLLPVVAKEVYLADRTMLAYMTACAATGALLGSLTMTRFASVMRPARLMMGAGAAWLFVGMLFALSPIPAIGLPLLVLAGFVSSVGLVLMAGILLRNSDQKFRGRIMGIRMLAIYSNIPGLLVAGPLITAYGYPRVAAGYAVFGLVATALILVRWRRHLWSAGAESNSR
jgi:MFS family permease